MHQVSGIQSNIKFVLITNFLKIVTTTFQTHYFKKIILVYIYTYITIYYSYTFINNDVADLLKCLQNKTKQNKTEYCYIK